LDPVTIIAAYAEPGDVFSLIMIPVLDHGCRPPGAVWFGPMSIVPVSDVTRTVNVPLPATGWCAKKNASWTGTPPGPVGWPGHPTVAPPLLTALPRRSRR
jgi:hypothetical protein